MKKYLDKWQEYFSKHFNKVLNKVGQIRSYIVQALFLGVLISPAKEVGQFPLNVKIEWINK